MPCERYRDALTDVAAGLAASPGVEAHLGSCEACREELQGLRQALAMADAELAGLLAAEPTPELAARIRPGGGGDGAFVALALRLAVARHGRGRPAARGPRPRDEPPHCRPHRRPEWSVESHQQEPAASPRATQAVDQPLAPPAAARSVPGVDGKGLVTPRSADRIGRRGVSRPAVSQPEVLVPTSEAEALLRFAAHVQTRAVSPDSLLVADLSAPLPEPKGVEIEPLVIVPLDPAETSGTD